MFDPPVEFEVEAMSSWDLQKSADDENIDFFYANSGWYSCMGLDYGVQPLATTVARQEVRGRTFDLDVYGGKCIFFVRRYHCACINGSLSPSSNKCFL
jgi:hypothetical protein